jgi:hypothetical protein
MNLCICLFPMNLDTSPKLTATVHCCVSLDFYAAKPYVVFHNKPKPEKLVMRQPIAHIPFKCVLLKECTFNTRYHIHIYHQPSHLQIYTLRIFYP